MALAEELGHDLGKALMGAYYTARPKVLYEVAEEIKASEPDLSDHGPRHIRNVHENVWELVGYNIKHFSPQELFILLVSILYHDVGNFYRRERHNKNILPIFLRTYGEGAPHLQQTKLLVLSIAGAHTGRHPSGSLDTITGVKDIPFGSKPIRAKEIAAVLRLADELAEGPQRTSAVRAESAGYGPDALPYQAYALSCKRPVISPELERIALDIHIEIDVTETGLLCHHVPLPEFLPFVYRRVTKLDQERKYAKFFTTSLAPFQTTSVQIHFWKGKEPLDVHLNPLVLSDVVVPGGSAPSLPEIDQAYDLEKVMDAIEKAVQL